jgi:hypothetical protein
MGTSASISKKLGVREGQSVVLLGAPERFAAKFEAELAGSFEDVKVSRQLRPALDCVLVFIDSLADLEDRICAVTERLLPEGQVWVAWRKRRAGDVREDVVRRIFLTAGMSGAKVGAIDSVWTGMRMVVRPENRDALAYRLAIAPRRARRATRPPQFESSRSLAGAGSGLANARARRRT